MEADPTRRSVDDEATVVASGPRRPRLMRVSWRRAPAWASAALTLIACTAGVDPAPARAPQTPPPTPPTTIAGICAASAPVLERLDAQLAQPVTTENLVDLGTTAATITGVIAVDEQRLRSAQSSEPALVDEWLAALTSAVDAGAAGVRSAAAGDVEGFAAAMRMMRNHRADARALASDVGYPACPY